MATTSWIDPDEGGSEDYASLTLWEADLGTGLTSDPHTAEVGPSSGSELDEYVTINTSETGPFVIQGKSGYRHDGSRGGSPTHARVINSSGTPDAVFTIHEPDVSFKYLDIENETTDTSAECFRLEEDTLTLTIENCIGGFASNNSEQDFVYISGQDDCVVNLTQCHVWNVERAGVDFYDGVSAYTADANINSCHFYNLGDGHRGTGGRGGVVGQGANNNSTFNVNVRSSLFHFDADGTHVFDIVCANGTQYVDQCITSEGDWSDYNASFTVTNSDESFTWATTDQGAGDYIIYGGAKDLRISDTANNDAIDYHSTLTANSLTIPTTDIIDTTRVSGGSPAQGSGYDLGAFEIIAGGPAAGVEIFRRRIEGY